MKISKSILPDLFCMILLHSAAELVEKRKGYNTLQKAIKAVKNGQTITVAKSIKTDDFLILESGTYTVPAIMNSKTITIKGGSFTNTKGLGYIEGDGKIEFTVSDYKKLFKVKKLTH